MGTWLFEGLASIGIFFLVLPVLIPVVLAVVYRRYRYLAVGPTAWAAVTALYVSALFAFTTFPLPTAPEEFCTKRSTFEYWRLTPGRSFAEVLDRVAEVGVPATVTSGLFLQVAFNVVFFVPLGFGVAYLLRRGIGWALAIGLGTSLVIEVAQGSALWGLYPCPYRVAEADDLITNTTGALVGWVIGALVTRVIPFREPARRTDLDLPTVRRRVLAAVTDLMLTGALTLGVDVAVAFVLDLQGIEAPAWQGWLTAVGIIVPTLLLLGVPLVRRDRATPGQAAVLLGLASVRTGQPAGPRGPIVRFGVRWLPLLLLGSVGILAVVVLESATVAIRRDRRSFAGLVGATTTCTHDALAALPQGNGRR